MSANSEPMTSWEPGSRGPAVADSGPLVAQVEVESGAVTLPESVSIVAVSDIRWSIPLLRDSSGGKF